MEMKKADTYFWHGTCRQRLVMLSAALALVASLLCGCRPSVPDRYVSPDDMADIIYDYHAAEGISSVLRADDTLAMRSFKAAILKKHGVTEAQFDSSMVYYTRHTQHLADIYDRVTERLNAELTAQGGSAYMADMAGGGDTTDIWRAAPCFVLGPYDAVNRKSFEVKADTSFYEGDRIFLDFDAAFVSSSNMHDALAVMAVTYANDSIEYVHNVISSSKAHLHLQVNNSGRLGIKHVRGFWLMNPDRVDDESRKKRVSMMVVSNVRLVCMHVAPVKDGSVAEDDTVRVDTVRTEMLMRNGEAFKRK